MTYIILTLIITLFIFFIIRLLIIKNNINIIEDEIKKVFFARTNMIPAIFDVTKNTFSKHDEIFKDILKYRNIELYKYYSSTEKNKNNELINLIHIEELIHHELNFIFKVANKHPKLTKKWNFIYLRWVILEKSSELWKLFEDYKVRVTLFNYLIKIKNYTLLWLLIPINKIRSI